MRADALTTLGFASLRASLAHWTSLGSASLRASLAVQRSQRLGR
jgi:hypothetical protein